MSITLTRLTPLQQWEAQVNSLVPTPSPQLAAITTAFQVYEGARTQTNLADLSAKLEVWRTTGLLKERAILAGDAKDLELYITRAEKANQVISAKASNVGANQFYDFISPLPADVAADCNGLLPPSLHLPVMGPQEIIKINEAFSRAYEAACAARDALAKLSPKLVTGVRIGGAVRTPPPAPTPPASPTMTLYTTWFGAWDHARFTKVLNGFEDICDAFDAKVQLYDIRNTTDGSGWYAACYPANVTRDTNRRVTSRVRMVMGRSFFSGAIPKRSGGTFNAQAAFSGTSDATLGTFVHEMAHGTFCAVDAPMVNPDCTWTLAPVSMVPGNPGFGLSPNPGSNQSSTPDMDRLLAQCHPAVAVFNADNYGQFARACVGASI